MPCSPSDPPPIPVAWPPSPHSAPIRVPIATPPAPPPPETPLLPRPRPAPRLISGCVQHFAATPTAAGWARRHATDVLARWQVAGMTDDVCLVVSELVGNAVIHAAAPDGIPTSCRLVLKLFADALAVEVTDPSGGIVTRAADDDPLSESGRGLAIVQALCGSPVLVYAEPGGGKTVVAVMPRGVA